MDGTRVAFARSSDHIGAYRLIELPPDIYKRVESGEQGVRCVRPFSFHGALRLCRMTIKGRTDDDAVICTEDKTYALRSVVHSNTFLVATPPGDGDDADVVVRDQVSQIFELVPMVPNVVGRLSTLLRDSEYLEGHEDDSDEAEGEELRPVSCGITFRVNAE